MLRRRLDRTSAQKFRKNALGVRAIFFDDYNDYIADNFSFDNRFGEFCLCLPAVPRQLELAGLHVRLTIARDRFWAPLVAAIYPLAFGIRLISSRLCTLADIGRIWISNCFLII